jgi:ATP-dependent RNA helicase DDX46/PRP5
MRDVLSLSNGKITNLRRVSYVVLDEADRILDMGFEPQVKIMLQNCRPDKQTVMFSATFPRSIESLARNILTSPIEIVVGNRGQTS